MTIKKKTLLLLTASALTVQLVTGLDRSTSQTIQPAISQTFPRASQQLAQAPLKRLIIVFATRRDATDLEKKAEIVTKFLSKQIGIPVEAVIADESAAVEALRANRADVAFLAGRAALRAEKTTGAKMYLAEVRSDYSGGHTYDSVLVVRKDSPLKKLANIKQTLGQLRGKRMAFASRTSGSGFIIPSSEFVGQGFVANPDRYNQFFSKVIYGDGYSSALQAVLKKQADVAAVSEYALNPPWITAQEAKQLKVIWAIPGVPAHGIVIDNDVPAPMRDKIINAFLKLNEPKNNAMFRSLYNSTKLVKVNHNQHLASMRRALQRAKLEP
jgi:phosphonate transport system substrate-binding protein